MFQQCQTLIEENQKLQNVLTSNQIPHVQVIDSVFLQTQVETLQWQLKQVCIQPFNILDLQEEIVDVLDQITLFPFLEYFMFDFEKNIQVLFLVLYFM